MIDAGTAALGCPAERRAADSLLVAGAPFFRSFYDLKKGTAEQAAEKVFCERDADLRR